jgi:DNA invertase Pin-like site-specific DNA recombinase
MRSMNATERRKRQVDTGTGVVHSLLYRRVSGAEHQREGVSLETQEQLLRSYAAAQPGWSIEAEYEDIMSGKRSDRPAYMAMLDHARKLRAEGAAVAIVVSRLDRLGRNKAEYFKAADELEKLGCHVHSVKDGGLLDETHAGILAVFAAKEAKLIAGRVGETRRTVVEKGWFYGRIPFGYRGREATDVEIATGCRKTMKQIEPDPIAGPIAREIFQRVANGQSLRSVTRWASALPAEVRTVSHKTPREPDALPDIWTGHYGSIQFMLRSATYVARPAEGADDVLSRPLARWEPIVSDDVWAACQTRLDGHKYRPHQASEKWLLTGFLRCPACGNRMVSSGVRAASNPALYKCTSAVLGGNCYKSVSVPAADALVLAMVGTVLDTFAQRAQRGAIQKALDVLDAPTADVSRELAALERKQEKAQHNLADAARMLVEGVLDKDGYSALRDAETATIKAIEFERARLTKSARPTGQKLPTAQMILESAGSWSTMLNSIKGVTVTVADQRTVLDRLVESVVVERTGWRKYDAQIRWTALGNRLAQAIAATSQKAS